MDFALICATHCKLREMADQGRFRSDLYYRLNGLTVQLPALRERTDFSALTERLLANINPRARRLPGPGFARALEPPTPGPATCASMPACCAPPVPCWTRMMTVSACSTCLMTWPKNSAPRRKLPRPPARAGGSHNLEELSRGVIRQALESSCGNISQAARRLGISRQTLYRKLND